MSCSRYCRKSVAVRLLLPRSLYQRYYDLAVRVCLEVVRLLEALAQDAVVVDLAIDGQGHGSFVIDQWLSASVCFA
jgi:hypothetical protein